MDVKSTGGRINLSVDEIHVQRNRGSDLIGVRRFIPLRATEASPAGPVISRTPMAKLRFPNAVLLSYFSPGFD